MGSGLHELSLQGSTCISPRDDKGSGHANGGAGSRWRRLQTLVEGWLGKEGRGHPHGRHQMSLCRLQRGSTLSVDSLNNELCLAARLCALPHAPGSTVWLQAGALEGDIPHISTNSTAHLYPRCVLGLVVCLLVRLFMLSLNHSTTIYYLRPREGHSRPDVSHSESPFFLLQTSTPSRHPEPIPSAYGAGTNPRRRGSPVPGCPPDSQPCTDRQASEQRPCQRRSRLRDSWAAGTVCAVLLTLL